MGDPCSVRITRAQKSRLLQITTLTLHLSDIPNIQNLVGSVGKKKNQMFTFSHNLSFR